MYLSKNGQISAGVGSSRCKPREFQPARFTLAFDGDLAIGRGLQIPIPGCRPTFHCPQEGVLSDEYGVDAVRGICAVSGFGLSVGNRLLSTATAIGKRDRPFNEVTELVSAMMLRTRSPRVSDVLTELTSANVCWSYFGDLILREYMALEAAEPFGEDSRLYPLFPSAQGTGDSQTDPSGLCQGAPTVGA